MSLDIPVYLSGIPDGSIIIGREKANKGTIIKVRGEYPPSQSALTRDNIVTNYEKLKLIYGHTEDIYQLLTNKATTNPDLYLHEVNLKIKFVKIGGHGFISKLDQATIDHLLKSDYLDIEQVYKMIPPNKPGSRAHRHTLIFRPKIWSLYLENNQINHAQGICINLLSGVINHEITASETHTIYKIPCHLINTDIYLYTLKNRDSVINLERIKLLISQLIPTDQWDEIYSLISWFPPSLYKSLIQKLIRTRCLYVNNSLKADLVLLMAFGLLLINPGSFNPDIQRFVTGLESATKRLAISIYEDSYSDYPNELLSMLAASILSQTDNNWRPEDECIKRWMIIALHSLQDSRMYQYNLHQESQLTTFNYYTCAYYLLSQLKSFSSDIKMLASIAGYQGVTRSTSNNRLANIPLIHCIDFHSYPEIAYYYDRIGLTYEKHFRKIFHEVTGVNPRKDDITSFETREFVVGTRKAQQLVWNVKTMGNKTNYQATDETKLIEYTLDKSWIAGLIGPIEVKVLSGVERMNETVTGAIVKGTAIVCLRPDDIYNFIAIKKPKREDKEVPELTEAEKYQAISYVKNVLETQGIQLKHVPDSLLWLKDAIIKLFDKYIIYLQGMTQAYNWEDLMQISVKFPIYKQIEEEGKSVISQAIRFTGNCISDQANIDSLCKETPIDILKRLLILMTGYKSTIDMYKINKKGIGNEYTVLEIDTQVFHLLCKLANWYPVALELVSAIKFKVKYGPVIWSIRDQIAKYCSNNFNESQWLIGNDIQGRKLWDHQMDAINRMKEKHELGKKGHLIWIPVRFGKTLIVMYYLKYRIERGDMPKYCVYTLPRAAIESISKQIEAFGLKYQVNGQQLLPYCINLIHHDQLRLNDDLKKYASEMIFINDEFHKTLNKTQRTSMALEISRLSNDFICLTGTLIKDNNIQDLIKWLEQNVEFEINQHNFWVGIASMISKKLSTKVIVNRYEIEAIIKESEKYKQLVPLSLGGYHHNPDTNDFRQACQICWQSSLHKMVELTIYYIRAGERIMLVAKDIESQEEMKRMLMSQGLNESFIFSINKSNVIDLPYQDPRNYYVVITTPTYSEGYSLSKMGITITGVYFGNQATRDQLEGRMNDVNQLRTEVMIITVHCGILSHILKKYDNVRSFSMAVKGFAELIKE